MVSCKKSQNLTTKILLLCVIGGSLSVHAHRVWVSRCKLIEFSAQFWPQRSLFAVFFFAHFMTTHTRSIDRRSCDSISPCSIVWGDLIASVLFCANLPLQLHTHSCIHDGTMETTENDVNKWVGEICLNDVKRWAAFLATHWPFEEVTL